MNVKIFSCGPVANDSESKAIAHLESKLRSTPGNQNWVLLTNLTFSVTHQQHASEIDIVSIGPSGVKVIEIKHWSTDWVAINEQIVEQEADRLSLKAKKVATTLKREFPNLPFVDAAFLLTREQSAGQKKNISPVLGIHLYSLRQWREALGFRDEITRDELSHHDIQYLSSLLEPRSKVILEGHVRRLAGYVNLNLVSNPEDRFHRIFKASHSARQDKVLFHLYDFSASDDKKAETKARREFDALHRLQHFSWAPRILDSFQALPGYDGEMYYFTTIDPAAPSIESRQKDESWSITDRLVYARNCLRSLIEYHSTGSEKIPAVHRNLSPTTLLVKHDNTPIFTGFNLSKIPSDMSVASATLPETEHQDFVAPEVRTSGLSAADQRSDAYSLYASLSMIFQELDADNAVDALLNALQENPEERSTLEEVEQSLTLLLGEELPEPPPPPSKYWTQDQIIPFRDSKYRIVNRVGSGGVGITFKVELIDNTTGEDLGTYIGKVAHNQETGNKVLKSYRIAKPILRHSGLSAIHEVATEWRDNEFIALMTWIEGSPLGDFSGVTELLVEEYPVESHMELVLKWLRDICGALNILHCNGLTHGDISPRNIILSNGELVLTDYDFVTKVGEVIHNPGTVKYCSPSFTDKKPANPSDDIYALAATFFDIVFDKDPFMYGSNRKKEAGINWGGIEKENYKSLATFIDAATDSDSSKRISSIDEALKLLDQVIRDETSYPEEFEEAGKDKYDSDLIVHEQPSPQHIEWLRSLLQSYPGSRYGNQETRGLDSDFAVQTYVPPQLEDVLIQNIKDRKTRLVVLCGNAGDGKTALLQQLALKLGVGSIKSSERLIEKELADGLIIRINLDGSASWNEKSADEIMNEFMEPFQHGNPSEDIAHLLAVNDGRLLEWIIESEFQNNGGTHLTESLEELLQKREAESAEHIQFINLNDRSLVGGVNEERTNIETGFVSDLLHKLYGGETAKEIWAPCNDCTAQTTCSVSQTQKVFAPHNSMANESSNDCTQRAKDRLIEALQAVHLRGEVHITTRELRAALVYILFGVHYCTDYHQDIEIPPFAYWNRAFDPLSPGRQGEVLSELAKFDPALEAHPQIDRYLLSDSVIDSENSAPRYGQPIDSARRRAYFEWTEDQILEVTDNVHSFGLAKGQYLRLFRNLPLSCEISSEKSLNEVCKALCRGISRLEDLPPSALERDNVVPLRITPRTPTESAFWVEKPLSKFRLKADLPPLIKGLERLHRHAYLIYEYRNGGVEKLLLGSELFHLLLDLSEGYQIGDVSTDDTFAQLSIFVQRLVREDENRLLAWNPMQDEAIFEIATLRHPESQHLVITEPTIGGAL